MLAPLAETARGEDLHHGEGRVSVGKEMVPLYLSEFLGEDSIKRYLSLCLTRVPNLGATLQRPATCSGPAMLRLRGPHQHEDATG